MLTEQDFVDSADQRTRKLTTFVKALLIFTQIRLSDNLEMEIFSLTNTISVALNTVETKAQDKSIALKSNIDVTDDKVFGNQLRLLKIFLSSFTVRNIFNRPKPLKQPVSQSKPGKMEDENTRSVTALMF